MTELETTLDEFDCLWQTSSRPPDLTEFVRQSAAEDDPPMAMLVELVAIDMEYRWRHGETGATGQRMNAANSVSSQTQQFDWDSTAERPLVEDYGQRWPNLVADTAATASLAAEEFRIRHRWGDCPRFDEYLQRFPNQHLLWDQLVAIANELALDDREEIASTHLPDDETLNPDDGHSIVRLFPEGHRYRILRRLGRGGMGTVYLADDTELERRVALKVPHASDGPKLWDRFINETRAAAMLQHPGICPILDVGRVGGRPFLTMRLIEGPTLHDVIKRGEPMPIEQVLEIFLRIVDAMQTAHTAGVVHRDLTPSNVMLEHGSQPVITDFGLACREHLPQDERITRTNDTFGSPAYMSPEQIEGRASDVGAASDIYSLGVMLFEALTGRLPFSGTVGTVLVRAARDAPPSPASFRPALDQRLEQLCLTMLAKDPQQRPASMQAVHSCLVAIRDQPPQERGSAAGWLNTPQPFLKRKSMAVIAVVIMLAFGGVWWTMHPDSQTPDATAAPDNPPAAAGEAAQASLLNTTGTALSLDGVDDYVKTPLVYDGSHPLTIEAWVAPADPYGDGIVISNSEASGLQLYQDYDERTNTRAWAVRIGDERQWLAQARCAGTFDHRPTHIASVWDGTVLRLFVNGKQDFAGTPLTEMIDVSQPLLIGTRYLKDPSGGFSNFYYHGEIDEVRISAVARYQADFVPQRRFEPDDSTLALYRFDEDSGATARDAGPGGNHAQIIGAERVAVATMNRPSPYASRLAAFEHSIRAVDTGSARSALAFVSSAARVEVPRLDMDFTEPFTIEAWVAPDADFQSDDWKRVVAQVGAWSLCIPMFHDVYAVQTWHLRRGTSVTSAVPGTAMYGRRTHLAAQWTGEEMQLFVNGHRSPAMPAFRNLRSTNSKSEMVAALVTANEDRLTIGQRGVGKSTLGGTIDQFRITRGVRYTHNFTPARFEPDDETVVMYDFHEGAGDILHDVSGNQWHGTIVAAEWISGDEQISLSREQ